MIPPIHIIAAAVVAYAQFVVFKCRHCGSEFPDWITGYDAENALRAEEADAMIRELNRTRMGCFGSDGSQATDQRVASHGAGYDVSGSISSPSLVPIKVVSLDPAPAKPQPKKKPAVQVGFRISPIVWHLLLAFAAAAVVALVIELWKRTQ